MSRILRRLFLATIVLISTAGLGSGSNTVFLTFPYFYRVHDHVLTQMDDRIQSEAARISRTHGTEEPSERFHIVELEPYQFRLVLKQFEKYEKVRIFLGRRTGFDLTFIQSPELKIISAIDKRGELYILKQRSSTLLPGGRHCPAPVTSLTYE